MTTTLTVSGRVATLHLGRPDQGNALDLDAATSMLAAVRECERHPDLAAVAVRADGPLFCAGGDVRAMAAAPQRPEFVHHLADVLHEALIALRALPLPIVAVVHGTAAGAGVGLVLAADLAIAGERAKFLSAYSRIGFSPDCGVSALLPAAVGARRAAQFALTDVTLDARTAVEWGLITECVADDELAARADALLAELATRPPRSLGQTARLLRFAPERTYAEQLADEADSIAQLSARAESAALVERFAAG